MIVIYGVGLVYGYHFARCLCLYFRFSVLFLRMQIS